MACLKFPRNHACSMTKSFKTFPHNSQIISGKHKPFHFEKAEVFTLKG